MPAARQAFRSTDPFSNDLITVFGDLEDPMTVVERRARALFGDGVIAWEGDPATFQFSFVSRRAEEALGYPRARWTEEPTFWADVVVHRDDKADAVAFCATATGKRRDHEFVYRAVTADGRVRYLRDIVRVCCGPRGVPVRLRGLMLDVTDDAGA